MGIANRPSGVESVESGKWVRTRDSDLEKRYANEMKEPRSFGLDIEDIKNQKGEF